MLLIYNVRKIVKNQIERLGLEKFLLEKGVSQQNIEHSKREMAMNSVDIEDKYAFFYDKVTEKKQQLIPVSKIKGVDRIGNFSWFNLLKYGLTGVPHTINYSEFNLNMISFLGKLEWLESYGINGLADMYNHTSNINFVCFRKNGNEEYYQCSDGNHRVITAKVFGLKTIRANNLYIFAYNQYRYNSYQLFVTKKKSSKGLHRANRLFYGRRLLRFLC